MNAVDALAARLDNLDNQIKEALANAEVVHCDESVPRKNIEKDVQYSVLH